MPSDEEESMTLSLSKFNQDKEIMEQKMRQRIIRKRNEHVDTDFIQFVQNKYKKLQFKQKYYEVAQNEINKEFDTNNLTQEYMKQKKFKDIIDFIQF